MVKKAKSRVGQAPALSARDWKRWLQFVLKHGTTQMACLLEFTGLFALRCGEACKLRAADLKLASNPPHLVVRKQKGAAKSPGVVPILPEQVKYLQDLRTEGLVWTRARRNRHQKWNYEDKFLLPMDGPLFPSMKARTRSITYHGVWAAVKRLSVQFGKQYPNNGFERIRTHSGRATAITRLMGEGVPLPMSMKFARHKPGSLRTHLMYGQLSCMDVYQSLSRTECCSGGDLSGFHEGLHRQRQQPALGKHFGALHGVSLKDITTWYKEGLLNKAEFVKAKAELWKSF
eukprot:6492801-Amphidinium_carterae.1